VPPELVAKPLLFETKLALEPEILARLAPAVEHPGIHLGVWRFGDQLRVWGTTRTIPMWCFILEVIAPGLVVVKYQRPDPTAKFANVAVLEGAKVKFITPRTGSLLDAPAALHPMLAFYFSAGFERSDSMLVRLAVSMRAHGRGGSLLVVPKDSTEWRESIALPISYSVAPPFSEMNAVEALAGPTAVDGATVISDEYELLAFGVKIIVRDGRSRIENVVVTEPVEGATESIVEPAQLGNTRHLSAAQFVSDQRDAIALVASQDGKFTVFSWSAARKMVVAHRLETLLL
jgi:hypothetical protein